MKMILKLKKRKRSFEFIFGIT